MNNTKPRQRGTWCFLILEALLFLLAFKAVMAASPEGALVSYISNSTKTVASPENRTDDKGYIHTITLTTTQQNGRWKAYVGNVSGILVLRDGQDYSIYEWTNIGSPTGQVYITRNDSVTWSGIKCVNATTTGGMNTSIEDNILGHNSASASSITGTFASQAIHSQITVGDYSIPANCSYSLFPYVNNAVQSVSNENQAQFQEILLTDGSSLIYTSIIEQDQLGYRADGTTTYDFQSLVPDTAVLLDPSTTYYFYIEISAI